MDLDTYEPQQWPSQTLSNRVIGASIPTLASIEPRRNTEPIDATDLYNQHLLETWPEAFTVDDQKKLLALLAPAARTRRQIREEERRQEREHALPRRVIRRLGSAYLFLTSF